jgi:hypothetical protein
MATHAKSKMAANLLRLGFIDFFLVLGFSVYICVGTLFGGRTNVFLLGKAETAAKTRQVFVDALPRAGAFPGASSRKVNERVIIRAVAIAPGVQGVAGIRRLRLHSPTV